MPDLGDTSTGTRCESFRNLPVHCLKGIRNQPGFTLLELIVATTILSLLAAMALPLARITVQREREKELRRALANARCH